MTSEEIAAAVIDALESIGMPYMIVGSLSSNYYGIPRSTKDADFLLQLPLVPLQRLVDILGPAFKLDPQMTFESVTLTRKHVITVVKAAFDVELFYLSEDPHDQERFRRRIRTDAYGRQTNLPSPEDVILTKLRWLSRINRNKDRDDIRDVIAVQSSKLDWTYIYHWCDQHGTRQLLDEIRASIPPIE